MKKTPKAENQLVTENENLSRENEKLIRENTKLRDALCAITGQLEAEAEMCTGGYLGRTPNLKKATEIYRDLIRLHKPSPMGKVSKRWISEWNEKLDYCYDLLDQARYDAEDIEQYLDDALVIPA